MEEVTLKDKVDTLYSERKLTKKEMRMPGKGKVSRSKMKKGFMTVMRIDDNSNIGFEKKKMEEGVYRLSTGEYHSAERGDMLSYKGKPFVIQPVKKLNPYNPLEGKNETYGQKYVMARMLGDTIKQKAKGGNIIVWLLVIGAVVFAINYFAGGA